MQNDKPNSKPDKPTPDFPLYAHHAGYWAKKILGQTRYFGRWDDPDGALRTYNLEREDWEAGGNPRKKIDVSQIDPVIGVRLGDGLNLFLDASLQRVHAGELGQRSYQDYKATSEKVLDGLDRHLSINQLSPDHWRRVYLSISKNRSQATIANEITRVKVIMNWLLSNRFIDREPHYGTEFRKPSKLNIRRSRANSGKKWFAADEIKKLIDSVRPSLKAMVLLGINCGLGNGDCAQLQTDWIDLESGWLDYARPKTGIDRRARLWPETIAAISSWQEKRPKVTSPFVFVTKFGNPWSDSDSADCAIAKAFIAECRDVGVYSPGRGFYGLRRTFETIAGKTKDQVAVDSIMGHVDNSMGAVYRQEIGDDRLEAVAEFVRAWLFGPEVLPKSRTSKARKKRSPNEAKATKRSKRSPQR